MNGARKAFKILVGIPYEEDIKKDEAWIGMMICAVAIVCTIIVLLCTGCACAYDGCVKHGTTAQMRLNCIDNKISDEKAILSIIGEAEDQGYEGMLAVACAIRNRGTLKGVFGINNLRVKHERYSKAIWFQAKKAWDISKELINDEQTYVNEKTKLKRKWKDGKMTLVEMPVTHHWRIDGYDLSGGANSWENLKAFGKPYWINSCEFKVIIGDHAFYKCPGYGKGE